jgi:hypothetical protein
MNRRESGIQPEIESLQFPAMLFNKSRLRVYSDAEALSAAWKRAVELGLFDDSLLVESSGKARGVRTVKIVGSIGPFFGFDLYLNRSMRIHFVFEGEWEPANVESIRERALKQWHKNSDAAGQDYAIEFERRLREAGDVESIIQVMQEQFEHQFERKR